MHFTITSSNDPDFEEVIQYDFDAAIARLKELCEGLLSNSPSSGESFTVKCVTT